MDRSQTSLTMAGARLTMAGLLLALALPAGGCGGGDGAAQTATGAGAGAAKTTGGADAAEDSGDFKLAFAPAESEDDRTAEEFLRRSAVVSDVVSTMNASFALPADIAVRVQAGDEGPAYDPASRTLVLNYPFVSYVAQTFSEADQEISDEELEQRTANVVAFVLLHEMGHAFVDQFDLPITGREEDSVDNLATVITGDFVQDGGDIALDFADFFDLLQKEPAQLAAEDFWDEHSLDVQRANQTACLVYGSDPAKYAELGKLIPAERKERCGDEWQQAEHSWSALLAPYTKS